MRREHWLYALRQYLDVPFLHQGRSKAGIDCVGLLACAAVDLGYPNEVAETLRDYERAPDSDMFLHRIKDFLMPKPCNRLQALDKQLLPGDVMAFWIDKRGRPRHVAVYTGRNPEGHDMMIHAHALERSKVVEQVINRSFWMPRLHSAWTLPQLEN